MHSEEVDLPDGLYQVTTPYLCAGFEVAGRKITRCAPILQKKLAYWVTSSRLITLTQHGALNMADAKAQTVNLASLLDATLDTIADLPDFVVPPNGSYILLVKDTGQRDINKQPMVAIDFVVLATVELSKPTEDAPVADGTEFSELFNFGNDPAKTQQVMKARYAKAAEQMGLPANASLKTVLDALKGQQIRATNTRRKDKNDDSKFYPKIDNIQLATA